MSPKGDIRKAVTPKIDRALREWPLAAHPAIPLIQGAVQIRILGPAGERRRIQTAVSGT